MPLLFACGGSPSVPREVTQIQNIAKEAATDGDAKGTAYSGNFVMTFVKAKSSSKAIVSKTASNKDTDILTCKQQDGSLECTSALTGGYLHGKVNANGEFVIANQGNASGLGYFAYSTNGNIDSQSEAIKGVFSSANDAAGTYYFGASSSLGQKKTGQYYLSTLTMKRTQASADDVRDLSVVEEQAEVEEE